MKVIDVKRIEIGRLIALLSVSVLIASNVFLFGPFNIYSGNVAEFHFPLLLVLSRYVLPFLIFCVIVSIIGLLLERSIYERYISVLLSIGVLLYIQGNILVWNYGLVGAGKLDFHTKSWRGWIDGSLWLMLLIVPFFFYRKISRIVAFISVILFTLQLAALGFTISQHHNILKANKDYSRGSVSHGKILQFSSTQNVLHIIPDSLQSTVFKQVIDSDPDRYYKAFEGFTFFTQATGSYPTTFLSIPAFLTSRRYRNEMPMLDYIKSVFKQKNILNVLLNNGYDVDLVTLKWYENAPHSLFFDVPAPYKASLKERLKRESDTILSWVWFRSLPHFLKEYYYYGGSEDTSSVKSQKALGPNQPGKKDAPRGALDPNNPKHRAALADRVRSISIADRDFLDDLIANSTAKGDKPVYKLLHMQQTHWPLFLTSSCQPGEILPDTWANQIVQSKCGIDEIVDVLNRLKSLGIYDSSLIVINADHGYAFLPNTLQYFNNINLDTQLDGKISQLAPNKEKFAEILGGALPIMLIKPPYSKGLLKLSDAQVELTDIPATIASLLGIKESFNGRSVFEISPNEAREREYFYYEKHPPKRTETNYNRTMTEYIINGSVFNVNSWKRDRIFAEPGSLLTKKVDFDGDSMEFLMSGWAFPENFEGLTVTWAMSHSSSIVLSLPKDKTVELTATVRNFLKGQNVTVKLDGDEIAKWRLSPDWRWEKHSVTLKPDSRRPNVSKLEFTFSETRPPDRSDKRPISVMFDSITLREE